VCRGMNFGWRRNHEQVLHPYWSDVLLPEQGFLENPKHITKILDMIPFEDSVRNDFLRKWKPQKAGGESLSASRWKECEKKINAEALRLSNKAGVGPEGKKTASALRRAALEVIPPLNTRKSKSHVTDRHIQGCA